MGGERQDFVVVGSGFGGSVSALRLAEKGYRVLVLEKGRRYAPEDYPTSNWQLRRWLWMPRLGLRGPFKMTFLRHLSAFTGVGVGGGSLVYANTLPTPTEAFFTSGTWAGLADWQAELAPHYGTALRMLGAADNPRVWPGDEVIREIGNELGRGQHFHPARVGVFFGEPEVEVEDPYFEGQGPRRTGCNQCGACMLGCKVGAKNTLDRNYLYLAEKQGCEIRTESEVLAVRPADGGGYRVVVRERLGWLRHRTYEVLTDKVVFSGGALGTVDLLLKMRADPEGLPGLSPRTGSFVRTNSEALFMVVTERKDLELSEGVAITSILHTDDHSHLEPVRYPKGSGFFRLLAMPHAAGNKVFSRLLGAIGVFLRHPVRFVRAALVWDLARRSQILLYMRTLEGTLRFSRGRGILTGLLPGLKSSVSEGESPKAFMPEATDLANRFADKVDGVVWSMQTEMVAGVPSTAHVLGGACIGATADSGVIGTDHQVHGYPGLYVVDGAAISANPGVNPSLSITAMAERAMAGIAPRTLRSGR